MIDFKKEDITRLMRESVDARCEKFNIKLKIAVYLSLILFTSVLCVVVFWDYPQEMKKGLIYYNVLFSVSYIPLILFSVFNYKRIVNGVDEYVFFETVLDEFGVSMGKYYFIASFFGKKGERYGGKTNALYREHSRLACFEEWRNARAIVAYSRLNGRVYVVCRADELSGILS